MNNSSASSNPSRKLWPTELTQWLACLTAAAIGLKPIFDIFWSKKVSLFSFLINVQGILGLTMLALGSVLAVKSIISTKNSTHIPKPIGALYIAFSIIAIRHAWFERPSIPWMSKYISGASGILAILWLMSFPKTFKILLWTCATSICVILTGCILQYFQLLPWEYFDISHTLGNIGRLTSFYHHPLDLLRVLVWIHFLWLIAALAPEKTHPGKRTWLPLFLINSVLILTTHRAALILCMLTVGLVALAQRSWKRGLVTALVMLAGWAIWTIVPNSPGNLISVFHPRYFYSVTSKQERAEAAQKKSYKNAHSFSLSLGFEFFRGRGDIWANHFTWLSENRPGEWAVGSTRAFPSDYFEDEPHNQILDLLENVGIAGLVAFFALIWVAARKLKPRRPWIICFSASLVVFSSTAEPLAMPTFVWWAFLFLCAPQWLNWPSSLWKSAVYPYKPKIRL